MRPENRADYIVLQTTEYKVATVPCSSAETGRPRPYSTRRQAPEVPIIEAARAWNLGLLGHPAKIRESRHLTGRDMFS